MRALYLDCREAVIVSDGQVRGLGRGVTVPAPVQRLACGGGLIAPGNVCAHTHLYSGLVPLGMPQPSPPPQSFVEILERIWWRLDRALDAASLRAAARLYIAESLLSGTTALVDHHESPAMIEGSLDILADAAQELGCRLLTCFGATERNGGLEEAQRGLAECARFVRGNQRPLVRGLVGLHASFTVSDSAVREAGELCQSLGVPLHVHMAEGEADLSDARERGYTGPLERLQKLGALPEGSVLAHGVHLTPEQVRAASEAGAWLVHNPRSNAGNGVGFAAALSASERVALGTDGYPADMRAERNAVVEQAEAVSLPLGDDAATARANTGCRIIAERFGIDFGPKLERGMAADLVVWRTPEDAQSAGVPARHVIVNGELVVEEGKLTRADIDAIRAEAREQAQGLWARMEKL